MSDLVHIVEGTEAASKTFLVFFLCSFILGGGGGGGGGVGIDFTDSHNRHRLASDMTSENPPS